MIIVSTDGSCLRNPGGAIGWAWVNHTGPSQSGGEPSGTNQVAELRAVLEAIRAHPGSEPMVIESDSQYAIKCASEWVSGWKRKGWRTASGEPVKNIDLVRGIDEALGERPGPVRFRWVRGHVGNHYNEEADKLAGEAARAVAAGAPAPAPVASVTGAETPAKTVSRAKSVARTVTRVERPTARAAAAAQPALFDLPAPDDSLTLF
ncbi:ribonuclease HI [Rhodococcus spelaei]|uniref:ribonuclease H n=1 Tax=Rhodococcus spelaei TaxID=2546320 RepID=A0A541BQH2_9NOCA|nr:ribonuclease H [Rhodococcus spelaei]TQF74564.1 ribonuclease HI [Rhodococcus spelaei]